MSPSNQARIADGDKGQKHQGDQMAQHFYFSFLGRNNAKYANNWINHLITMI
jgi:hypothetical protein